MHKFWKFIKIILYYIIVIWKMHGYIQFSFWVLIKYYNPVAKICFSHIVINCEKIWCLWIEHTILKEMTRRHNWKYYFLLEGLGGKMTWGFPRSMERLSEGLGGKRGVSGDLAFRIEISPETVHFGLQICDISKVLFCFKTNDWNALFPTTFLDSHCSLQPPLPPLPPMHCWLIARKLFVTQTLGKFQF